MTYRRPLFLALLWTFIGLAQVRGEAPAASGLRGATPSLFDPIRHMRVAEVHSGMSGYGLTVFKGTKLERFDVEVVSVLKNFNPKYDVVLIRCKGQYLEHTGSIAGMSGSPVYLKDDQGRYRMIGAFAYGWPLTKDPVAGVQPIEYMLKLPAGSDGALAGELKPTTQPSPSGGRPIGGNGHHGLSWSLVDSGLAPFWKGLETGAPARNFSPLTASHRLDASDAPQLQPLATPLMCGGLSPTLLNKVAPLFASSGMKLLQAGGGSSSTSTNVSAKLEPGSVLAVPLLTGDVDLTAIGTVTEVLGDRVFGFGHPFNNEGAVSLPMGGGEIYGVIANLQTSFKLGSLTRERGRINTDESVGVAGLVGPSAPTVPIEYHVKYADGAAAQTYRFNSVLHPKFTPMIAGVSLAAAVTGPSELPQYNTLDYDLKLEFANGQTIDIANTSVNANVQEMLGEIALPLMAASENPFERVQIKKIRGDVKISAEAREAQILDVNVPRSRYRPSETVKAFVTYKPFRGEEGILPIDLELPRDLSQGTYQLIISDAQRYFQDEQQSRPFRFTAQNIAEVFGVLKDVAGMRQNAVYVRLLRQADGVAVGRVALPQLPSSRRQILLGAGRSDVTPYVTSTVKVIPTSMVTSGSAEFAITIDPAARVEVLGPKPANPEPAAAPQPTKAKESHKPADAEVPKNPDQPKE